MKKIYEKPEIQQVELTAQENIADIMSGDQGIRSNTVFPPMGG